MASECATWIYLQQTRVLALHQETTMGTAAPCAGVLLSPCNRGPEVN